MKSTACIYLLPFSPIFNLDEINTFNSFSKVFSQQLYQALYFNNKEILSKLDENIKIVYCLDRKDVEFIPEDFYSNAVNVRFFDTNKDWNFINKLIYSHTPKITNHFFLFSNTIGITRTELLRYINLLFQEDNTLVIGKSSEDITTFFGFNIFNTELLKKTPYGNLTFDSMINYACRTENFLYILPKGMLVHTIDDFRKLYTLLSTRESEHFCSQKMHELFINVFIEYKDILK